MALLLCSNFLTASTAAFFSEPAVVPPDDALMDDENGHLKWTYLETIGQLAGIFGRPDNAMKRQSAADDDVDV